MSAAHGSTQAPDAPSTTGYFVYGIVPADVEVATDARGIGDPPRRVSVVRRGDIAALVSEVPLDRPVGEPSDVMAYAQLLDATASAAPVLPMRFGAVMTDANSVADELLSPNHDGFRAALAEVDGRVEYVVRGKYVEDTLLREILSENEGLAQQREAIQGLPADATHGARIALGEAISHAVDAKRDADARTLLGQIEQCSVAVNVREPVADDDAVHIAVLVDANREADFSDRVAEAGRLWAGRVDMRLLGPMAPYDFVVTQNAGVA